MAMTQPGLPAGIPGIGVDLCAVARMEKSLQKPGFAGHVFSKEEQQWLEGLPTGRRGASAAANFAAKEAFLKAVGTGLGGFALPEIAVLRAPGGAPYFQLYGRAAEWAAQNGICARVSLTHESGLACAFVVLEGGGKKSAPV